MRFRAVSVLLLYSPAMLFAQSFAPVAAPGLTIPSGSLPWAVDRFEDKQELVPVHHSTIEVNNHRGANVAGSLAGSFLYKPKMTTELPGLHARTALHDQKPSFYVHLMQDDPDRGGDSPGSQTTTWALVRATLTKDHRVMAKIQFTQLTGNAKRTDGLVETKLETLPGGWIRLTPVAALETGEYALMPIPKTQNTFSTVVYDFSIDPAAPNAKDAVPAEPAS